MERFLELIGKIPTTQGQFVVAAICILATCVRYVASHSGWVPDGVWLAFLTGLAGIAGGQFLAKRATDHGYVAAKAAKANPAP